ncbi:hypothetical protein SM007_28270 [Streptomyces avermitilis]|uniref:Aminoglycoside phosphotransferase domain-containing protein n=1 Tax=Streptomyces avermitilis TaxID=33903 RepID=A0A4D4MAJ6_STRAX|nr:hypothetical protein [Streptomyces avermitilis]OOV24760.1 hypothetical protein SM007_28270 [Streptomyces avermitilis]GDY68895.1 hypothetical protein SAV14893_082880 [Streptomyces avermitilis]GDY70722.1 hypothetical protein SAV31267_002070 [Streptomyces avermitilis]
MQTLDDWLSDRREALKATSRERATSFERAAEALPTYLAALELTDLGPMAGSPLSPHVLREVRLGDGSVAVLKLIGEPQHAEAATLAAWTAHRVPCAPLLDHAVGAHAPDITHLLLRKVSGVGLLHAEMAAATEQIVRLFHQAHLTRPAGVARLQDFLGPKLEDALRVWNEAGLPSPDGVLHVLEDPAIEPVLLHGDAVGFNLLRSGDEFALIDPAGVCGPAEFDAARWVARCLAVTGPSALSGLTETALSADPSLSRRLLDVCVAVELVIEVRHRTTSPHVFLSIGAPAQTFTADTRRLAEAVAHRLTGAG